MVLIEEIYQYHFYELCQNTHDSSTRRVLVVRGSDKLQNSQTLSDQLDTQFRRQCLRNSN